MTTIWERVRNVFSPAAEPSRRGQFVVAEDENSITVGWRWGASDRERQDYTREEILEQALEAWRVNPLARRLVELTTQYVVGSGLRVSVTSPPTPPRSGEGGRTGEGEDDAAEKYVDEWWNHKLNQVDLRLSEWCDELTRAGELFLLVSQDAGGMAYVRAVAAEQVLEVVTAANDVQQEREYVVKTIDGQDEVIYPSKGEAAAGEAFMLHYAINRPVGTVRGESDLAPVLRWLSRYSGWLEDRARLNRYRNTFLFTVKAKFADETERAARQAALALTPPQPGSILVTDESEEWAVINPQLESHEANADGLALKKMIAAGAGVPLHFLAEPESSTRTTAEAAGGPTYRRFEQRQRFFCLVIEDLIGVVLDLHGMSAQVKVTGADLSARDNAALAVAGSAVGSVALDLRDRQVMDDAEVLRLVYRFLGENVDLAEVLENGKKAGPPTLPVMPGAEGNPEVETANIPGRGKGKKKVEAGEKIKVKIDADSGDVNTD